MRSRFLREVAALGLPESPRGSAPERVITPADLDPLPAAAQRYLRFMGVVGALRHWSVRLGWYGGFRTKPGGPWLPCDAWQYNTRYPVTRFFNMRVRFSGLFPVIVHDTYLQGRGHMVGKLLGLFPVADDESSEVAIGELVTYLNDCIFLAPSMLLGPETTWASIDDASFEVSLTDRDHTVAARVFVDERGAVTDFSTTDRFYQPAGSPPGQWLRTRWTTPIDGWDTAGPTPLPVRGQAVWQLPEGPFAYADFRILPGSLAYDVTPGK